MTGGDRPFLPDALAFTLVYITRWFGRGGLVRLVLERPAPTLEDNLGIKKLTLEFIKPHIRDGVYPKRERGMHTQKHGRGEK